MIPASRCKRFAVTKNPPADFAVVPPGSGRLSSTTTSQPLAAALLAAARAAAPAPTTTTSVSIVPSNPPAPRAVESRGLIPCASLGIGLKRPHLSGRLVSGDGPFAERRRSSLPRREV